MLCLVGVASALLSRVGAVLRWGDISVGDVGVGDSSVGEETGKLDEMLYQVADVYDREVAAAVKRALALIEPVMIVGLALLIGAGAGDWAARHPDRAARLAAWRVPGRLRWVEWVGRHSLAVYLLHQPLLLGALLLARQLR